MPLIALTLVALAFLPACFGEWWLTVVLLVGLGVYAAVMRERERY